jgi:hypothetical protein
MAVLLVLAQEGGTKTLWNPTILGVLVVISAIMLFCGSVYLLLATNLGARLGFLVAAASLTGFLVLLSILWMTTFTPLESPKGRDSSWKVKEVVTAPADSKITKVQDIQRTGEKIGTEDLATIRPAIDGALVLPTPAQTAAGQKPTEFSKFNTSSDYLVGEQGLSAYNIGGGTRNLFWHKPRFAAVEFCQIDQKAQQVPFGEAPPAPVCDKLIPHQFVILERDLGSLRQPPVVYFFTFLVLFGLSLLGLHWYELDQREAKARGLAPVPTT